MSLAHIDQTEDIYRQAKMRIRTEITRARNLYYVYFKLVDNFNYGLLE
jgi:hypothetical protein